MEEIIVLTPRQLERIVSEAVARGIEKVQPLLLKAANEYISKDEVAVRFGIGKRTLDDWRRKGTGPAYYEKGSLLLYRVDDVVKFLSEFRVDPELD